MAWEGAPLALIPHLLRLLTTEVEGAMEEAMAEATVDSHTCLLRLRLMEEDAHHLCHLRPSMRR